MPRCWTLATAQQAANPRRFAAGMTCRVAPEKHTAGSGLTARSTGAGTAMSCAAGQMPRAAQKARAQDAGRVPPDHPTLRQTPEVHRGVVAGAWPLNLHGRWGASLRYLS